MLFSPAERSFLGVLEQAVADEYRVFGKVRVGDVIEPRRGMDRSKHQTAFNRINAKHFDFVLCAPGDLSVVCAVELDDVSHQQSRRRDRDGFLAAACESAALPLLQVQAQRTHSIDDLRARIRAVLDVKPQSVARA